MGWICLRKRRQNLKKNKEVIKTMMRQPSTQYLYTSLTRFNMKDVQNLNNGMIRGKGRILDVRNTIKSGSEA